MKLAGGIGNLAGLSLGLCLGLYAQVPSPPLIAAAPPKPPTAATFKVDVNLVPVQVSVQDDRGRAVGNLNRDDFQIFEDGREQEISSFSHDELPLAVALVIDNSSSIVAELQELRVEALDTLAQLKPEDKVAIFSFGEKPEMVEGLTSNHEALSVDLWALSPYGGTDINGALYEAALYLGRAAPNRRRAVILISDNEPSNETSRSADQVEQAALQSETPIYSIRVGFLQHSRGFFLTHPEARLHDVARICHQTGGELIDTHNGPTVSTAMATIFSWLKQGYSLGYYPTNKRKDGSYRTIEVRLKDARSEGSKKYNLYARKGYYSPTAY